MIVSIQDYFSDAVQPTKLLTSMRNFVEVHSNSPDLYYLHLHRYMAFLADDSYLRLIDPEGLKRAIGDQAGFLVVDLSHEGVVYRDPFDVRMERLSAETGIPIHRIVFVQTNTAFARGLEQSAPADASVRAMRHAWFHHHLAHLADDAVKRGWYRDGHRRIEQARSPERSVLCLNASPRPHRLALATLIARDSAREQYLCTLRLDALQKVQLKSSLPAAAHWLAHRGFSPEDVVATLTKHEFDRSAFSHLNPGGLVLALEPELYEKTAMSAVTETEMTDGRNERYTEKSLKPLAMGHPLIIAGNPNTLPNLEAWGFDVFRDVVESSYDAVRSPLERFDRVWDVMHHWAVSSCDVFRSPEMRERLHENVAQFEGRLREAVRAKTFESLSAAVGL